MARVNLIQTSFNGGELSPRVLGNTEIDRYAKGLRQCRNAYPTMHGGVKRRPGFRYTLPAINNSPGGSLLVPFVQGRAQAWMLEFGDGITGGEIRVYNADGTSTGIVLASPYSASLLDQLDWAQSDSTLYLFFPFLPVHRLQRLAGGQWVLSELDLIQPPFSEGGFRETPFATLSASTVGTGRTVTALANVFLAADVGRGLVADSGGIAVITAVGSATSATVTINRVFAGTSLSPGQWALEGSPQATCTPSADGPLGATITLTLDADGWRNTDPGAIVRINGGLVRIATYTDALTVSGVIVRELAATVAAPPNAWSLEPAVWGGNDYPRTGTVYQQRLIVAGSRRFPRTVWGSVIGEPGNFELGTTDDAAFAFTIDSDEASPIAYISGTRSLAVFTESGEYSMRSGVEKPITPTNVRIEQESGHGCAQVRPMTVGSGETAFIQRAGRKVRSYGYRYDFDRFVSLDLSVLAEHITASGVRSMAYTDEPDQVLWMVRNDGKLASCTIDRDQQPSVIAWALHETDGTVESVASIPNGEVDQLWAIVRRDRLGAQVRYVERLDAGIQPFHPSANNPAIYGATADSCIVLDSPDPAAPLTTFSVPHLAGRTAQVLGDGSNRGVVTVAADGSFTLARAAARVVVGLPFTSRITLLTPEYGLGNGTAQAQPARSARLDMRFLDTLGATVENTHGQQQLVPFQRFDVQTFDRAPALYTGWVGVSMLGWDRDDVDISILQTDPYPMHLLSVVRRHTANGG